MEPLQPDHLRAQNTRYDAQISVFGAALQKKLEAANVFVVGAGSVGCEMLKNLALMGVSCSSGGKLTVIDDSVIEKNNLSRQFLFHGQNIGQAKCTVAASAAALINPGLSVEPIQIRVGPKTENVLDNTSWENQSAVICASDNVKDRLYVDRRCVYFEKPLLDSGILGAKCSTQIVIPHLTENYGASIDPPAKQAAISDVRSFPYTIEHCIVWARSEFEDLFTTIPAEANAYLSIPSGCSSAVLNVYNLGRILDCLNRCTTFHDCILWARLK